MFQEISLHVNVVCVCVRERFHFYTNQTFHVNKQCDIKYIYVFSCTHLLVNINTLCCTAHTQAATSGNVLKYVMLSVRDRAARHEESQVFKKYMVLLNQK